MQKVQYINDNFTLRCNSLHYLRCSILNAVQRCALTAAVLLACAVVLRAQYTVQYDLAAASVNITERGIYRIYQTNPATPTSKTITIKAQATVVLDGVNISLTSGNTPPIQVDSNAVIYLQKKNTLTPATSEGLKINANVSVTVNGSIFDTLKVSRSASSTTPLIGNTVRFRSVAINGCVVMLNNSNAANAVGVGNAIAVPIAPQKITINGGIIIGNDKLKPLINSIDTLHIVNGTMITGDSIKCVGGGKTVIDGSSVKLTKPVGSARDLSGRTIQIIKGCMGTYDVPDNARIAAVSVGGSLRGCFGTRHSDDNNLYIYAPTDVEVKITHYFDNHICEYKYQDNKNLNEILNCASSPSSLPHFNFTPLSLIMPYHNQILGINISGSGGKGGHAFSGTAMLPPPLTTVVKINGNMAFAEKGTNLQRSMHLNIGSYNLRIEYGGDETYSPAYIDTFVIINKGKSDPHNAIAGATYNPALNLGNVVLQEVPKLGFKGVWTWQPDSVSVLLGDAGVKTHTAIYTDTSSNFDTVMRKITFRVIKDTAQVYDTVLNDTLRVPYKLGLKLMYVNLPTNTNEILGYRPINGNWSWKRPNNAITNTGVRLNDTAVYTPQNSDTVNYKSSAHRLFVKVGKGKPRVLTLPTADTLRYTDVLKRKDIPLRYGSVKVDTPVPVNANTAVAGRWKWQDSNAMANAPIPEPGKIQQTFSWRVIFYPADPTKWDTVMRVVSVTIKLGKLTNLVPNPDIDTVVYLPTLRLNNIGIRNKSSAIKGAWYWQDANTTVGNAGNKKAWAYFSPSEAGYDTVRRELSYFVRRAYANVIAPLEDIKLSYHEGLKLDSNTFNPVTAGATYNTAVNYNPAGGKWKWKQPNIVILAPGRYTSTAIYQPVGLDTINYLPVQFTLNINVDKRLLEMKDHKIFFDTLKTYNPLLKRKDFKFHPDTMAKNISNAGEAGADSLVAGVWAWQYPDSVVGNAGVYIWTAIFTPKCCRKYHILTQNFTITIAKSPSYIPDSTHLDTIVLRYRENLMLKNINIPYLTDKLCPSHSQCDTAYAPAGGVWSWKNGDRLFDTVGIFSDTGVYTPFGSSGHLNYLNSESRLIIKIIKGKAIVSPVLALEYDSVVYRPEALRKDVHFIGGKTDPDSSGVWAWENENDPAGNVRWDTWRAIFTPYPGYYAPRYDTLVREFRVRIYRANSNIPMLRFDTLHIFYSDILKTGDVELPDSTYNIGYIGLDVRDYIYIPDSGVWKWDDPGKDLDSACLYKEIATYYPKPWADSNNYNPASRVFDILVHRTKPRWTASPDISPLVYAPDRTLTDTVFHNNGTAYHPDGRWTWKDTAELAGIVSGNLHWAIFTPFDLSRWDTIMRELFQDVVRSPPKTPEIHDTVFTYYRLNMVLDSVPLPSNTVAGWGYVPDSGEWRWYKPNKTIGVGIYRDTAIYYPSEVNGDTNNYFTGQWEFVLHVKKGKPVWIPDATADTVTYDSLLTLAKVPIIQPTGVIDPPGVWEWADTNAFAGKAGLRTHWMVFRADAKNLWDTVMRQASFWVRKARPHPALPDSLLGYCGDILQSIPLPKEYRWLNSQDIVAMNDYGESRYGAFYMPEDSANYYGIDTTVEVIAVCMDMANVTEKPHGSRRYVVNDCTTDMLTLNFVTTNPRVNVIYNAEKVDSIQIDVSRPDVYEVSYSVMIGSMVRHRTLYVERRFQFENIVVQKGQILVVNNNPFTNGDYEFVSYQWWRDGHPVGEDRQEFYEGTYEKMESLYATSKYGVTMVTNTGKQISTCDDNIRNVEAARTNLRAYPSPVQQGGTITLELTPNARAQKVEIYNITGGLASVLPVTGATMHIFANLTPGVYVIKAGTGMATIVVK